MDTAIYMIPYLSALYRFEELVAKSNGRSQPEIPGIKFVYDRVGVHEVARFKQYWDHTFTAPHIPPNVSLLHVWLQCFYCSDCWCVLVLCAIVSLQHRFAMTLSLNVPPFHTCSRRPQCCRLSPRDLWPPWDYTSILTWFFFLFSSFAPSLHRFDWPM